MQLEGRLNGLPGGNVHMQWRTLRVLLVDQPNQPNITTTESPTVWYETARELGSIQVLTTSTFSDLRVLCRKFLQTPPLPPVFHFLDACGHKITKRKENKLCLPRESVFVVGGGHTTEGPRRVRIMRRQRAAHDRHIETINKVITTFIVLM